jgi:hypothetical protein
MMILMVSCAIEEDRPRTLVPCWVGTKNLAGSSIISDMRQGQICDIHKGGYL